MDGQVLIIDIWNLFVICFLLFGALFQNLFDFIDKHFIFLYFVFSLVSALAFFLPFHKAMFLFC